MPRKKGRWGEGTYVLECSSVVEHFCNICEALSSLASTWKSTWCYRWRKTTGGLTLGAVFCPRPRVPASCPPWSQLLCPTACPCMLKPGAPRNHSFFKFSLSALCHGDEKNCQAVFILTITKAFSIWFSFQSNFCMAGHESLRFQLYVFF